MRAHLLDLSASGALVHSATPPAVGTVVQVALDTSSCAATVMWVDGNRFGLAFAVAFSEPRFADLIERISTGG